MSRVDFLAKYATALQAIGDGEWPVPPGAWIVHMADLAGYFDDELQARVRVGLLAAIRWRRHCLAAKNHHTNPSTSCE